MYTNFDLLEDVSLKVSNITQRHKEHLFLKKRLTTTPILHHSDPDLQFLVEVGTYESDVGAVISQGKVTI